MNTGMDQSPSTVPAWARLTVGAVCLALALTALGEAYLALFRDPRNWSMFGFAVMTALTGGFGLAFAAGMLRDVPPMTLACIAGSVLVCSALGSFGLDRWFVPLSKKWWLVGRGGLTAVLLVVTVVVTLGGRRESWRILSTALLWVIPLALLGVWYAVAKLKPLLTATTGTAEFLRLGALTALSLVGIACLCGAVHHTIRAFETAVPPRDAPPAR